MLAVQFLSLALALECSHGDLGMSERDGPLYRSPSERVAAEQSVYVSSCSKYESSWPVNEVATRLIEVR